MRERDWLWLWPLMASVRMRGAVREHWKRILIGAFVGWVFAVIGGAIALASLELHNVISRATADELGVILVLYGIGFGALLAYAVRPRAMAFAEESTATRHRRL